MSLDFDGVWVPTVKSGVFPHGCLNCDRAAVAKRRCSVCSRFDDSENWSLFPIVKIQKYLPLDKNVYSGKLFNA